MLDRFIDGGLVANNPTLDILTEIHERNQALRGVGRAAEVEEVGVVLSLGTGDPPTEKVDSVDLKLPDNILGIYSAVTGASAMGRLLVDQAASATNRSPAPQLVTDKASWHKFSPRGCINESFAKTFLLCKPMATARP